jgi:peptidase C39-like protein
MNVLLAFAFAAVIALGSCSHHRDDCATTPTAPGCEAVPPSSRVLSITPIAQQTEVWCWAATAEMVFRHFNLPSVNGFGNYQCGIVAAYFGGPCLQNCGLCVSPIGGMTELNRVIVNYGPVARQLGLPSPILTSQLLFRALSFAETKSEIDAGRPVVAGITAGGFPFPNFSQHVTVIVGYETSAAGQYLVVNDPFPYNLPQFILQGRPNPYMFAGATEIRPGQYRVRYDSYTGFMAWGNSIDQIRVSS